MTPYYEDEWVTIYHGDCRELVGGLEPETVVTDPVWPNAHPNMEGADDPFGLFGDLMGALPATVRRLVVWLGCQSDPRFLEAVPDRFPFLRMQYLRRAVPIYPKATGSFELVNSLEVAGRC